MSELRDTLAQYRAVVEKCQAVFMDKAADYGTSWRVLRPISIVDQLYIKAWRIRQIQEKGVQRIADSIESEFSGIVNYGIIGLIQFALPDAAPIDLTPTAAKENYQQQAAIAEHLMQQKNHDYGEAWREMSQQSFADLILVKLLRIRQILANEGKTIVSEGIEANFTDIINYAVFALIRMEETRDK